MINYFCIINEQYIIILVIRCFYHLFKHYRMVEILWIAALLISRKLRLSHLNFSIYIYIYITALRIRDIPYFGSQHIFQMTILGISRTLRSLRLNATCGVSCEFQTFAELRSDHRRLKAEIEVDIIDDGLPKDYRLQVFKLSSRRLDAIVSKAVGQGRKFASFQSYCIYLFDLLWKEWFRFKFKNLSDGLELVTSFCTDNIITTHYAF